MIGQAYSLFPWELDQADIGSGDRATGPGCRWRQALASGNIQRDGAQETILPLLDQVAAHMNLPVRRIPWRGVEVWRGLTGEIPAVRGVYLHGDVGRGKSLLMQFIFDSVLITEKRRVHFHPFMEELHQRLHQAHPPQNVDLVLHVASQIAAEARLLCFDEFYITNIADGVLLGRLLGALHQCGTTVCATSNWAPDQLFQDGFNRGSVLPFIALLKKRIHVCELGHGADWRRQSAGHAGQTSGSAAELFTLLAHGTPQSTTIQLRHTPVQAHGVTNGIFWFGFEELCNRMLGRAEYMNLCHQAKMVIISGLPKLSCDSADMAMRFVVLVDLLYEHRIPLQIYSQVELDEACAEGPAAFAWRRSVSRIHELSRISGPHHG
ncbi:MAG: cell division protein ZapE [Magnetococcus sp. DMHC-8]